MRRLRVLVAALALAITGGGCAWLVRSSVSSTGDQANGPSVHAVVSSDGRFTAFESSASNLVSNDTNGVADIFVRDNRTGKTERVSLANDGSQSTADCSDPAISGDGRFVAFDSFASNLVTGDTNGVGDVFVRDRLLGTTTRVSVATGGAQVNGTSRAPSISADGNIVAFQSVATDLVPGDSNAVDDVFVRNISAGTTARVSIPKGGSGEANGRSIGAVVDPTGAWVAYQSSATNLVPGDTNGADDVFLRQVGDVNNVFRFGGDFGGGDAALSAPQGGFQIPLVAYDSFSNDIVPGITNGVSNAYVSAAGGSSEVVSVANDGSQSDGSSFAPSISGDGLRIAFQSFATNLVTGDGNAKTDVFVRDRNAAVFGGHTRETTTRASETEAVNGPGTQGNGDSQRPSLSRDGRYVAFESFASNLVDGDTNNAFDVFTRFAIPPTVDSVTPAVGTRGSGPQTVAVFGSHFLYGPDPTVDFGPGVTVQSITNRRPGEVDVTITIAGNAPTGPHTVFVLDTGTGPGPAAVGGGGCQSCFTVN